MKNLTLIASLLALMPLAKANADIVTRSAIVPGASSLADTFIIGGLIVVVLAILVSWLVLRAIRRKNVNPAL